MPRGTRLILGPLLGGSIGLIGGIAGLVIGIILGFLVQELFGQFRNDRDILAFFDNPGKSNFNEGEPGLAAFCGLGILIMVKSSELSHESEEAAVRETCRCAKTYFPRNTADPGMIEYFCRLAWSKKDSLNPDLLSENLASRRKSSGDPARLGEALYNLASSDKGREYASDIRVILDPQYRPLPERKDPWRILGLSPGTPISELKSHFRKLASQFHPDGLQGLDDEHRETAARAFIAIQEAYREILEKADTGQDQQ